MKKRFVVQYLIIILVIAAAVTALTLGKGRGAFAVAGYVSDLSRTVKLARALKIPEYDVDRDGNTTVTYPQGKNPPAPQKISAVKKPAAQPGGCLDDDGRGTECPAGNVVVVHKSGGGMEQADACADAGGPDQFFLIRWWREMRCRLARFIAPSDN